MSDGKMKLLILITVCTDFRPAPFLDELVFNEGVISVSNFAFNGTHFLCIFSTTFLLPLMDERAQKNEKCIGKCAFKIPRCIHFLFSQKMSKSLKRTVYIRIYTYIHIYFPDVLELQ
jgi:hypothetical protein